MDDIRIDMFSEPEIEMTLWFDDGMDCPISGMSNEDFMECVKLLRESDDNWSLDEVSEDRLWRLRSAELMKKKL